jgi:8-oxo-dGTP diphosphatase
VAAGDGNGWVDCRCGSRHWGRHGAAGLLLLDPRADHEGAGVGGEAGLVLLQHRAAWTHEGGSWSLVGGARDSHESEVAAALREAAEEAGVPAGEVRVLGTVTGVDHTDWSYTYVVALAEGPVRATVLTDESLELRWVPVADACRLPLHHALDSAWPGLLPTIERVLLTGEL